MADNRIYVRKRGTTAEGGRAGKSSEKKERECVTGETKTGAGPQNRGKQGESYKSRRSFHTFDCGSYRSNAFYMHQLCIAD